MSDSASIDRIRGAKVEKEPFEHAVIDGFLEPDLFAALRRTYPDSAEMTDVKARRAIENDLYVDGRRFLSADDLASAIDAESGIRPFARLLELVRSPAYSAAFVERFAGTVARELARHRRDALTAKVIVEVIVDGTGFALHPHTDGDLKIGSALIYFADPGDPSEHGTRLYRPLRPGLKCRTGQSFYRFESFAEADVVPYRPNTAFLFARTSTSFHGVAASTSVIPRRLIQVSVMLTRRQRVAPAG